MSRADKTESRSSSNGQSGARDKEPIRPKGHQTRQRLLTAAATVFERDGYLTARVADIVAEAGVAHGSFYTYFDSKENVFRETAAEVVDEINEALDAAVGTGQTADEIVRAGTQMFFNMYERHAPMLALIEQVGATDDYFREMRLDLRSRLTRRVERAIRNLEDRGFTDLEGLDRRVLAEALSGLLDNFSYSVFVLKEPFAERDLDTLYAIWLRSLGVNKGSKNRR